MNLGCLVRTGCVMCGAAILLFTGAGASSCARLGEDGLLSKQDRMDAPAPRDREKSQAGEISSPVGPAGPGGYSEPADASGPQASREAESAPAPKQIARETVRTVKDKECAKTLRARDKEIQALRRQVWVLRHQIEALEAIHREIQQKKELVSPP